MTDNLSKDDIDYEIKRIEDSLLFIGTQVSAIQTDPNKFADSRINKLESVIATLPIRKPTYRGNVTMRDHLLSLKTKVENDRIAWSEAEKERFLVEKNQLETELDRLSVIDNGS